MNSGVVAASVGVVSMDILLPVKLVKPVLVLESTANVKPKRLRALSYTRGNATIFSLYFKMLDTQKHRFLSDKIISLERE